MSADPSKNSSRLPITPAERAAHKQRLMREMKILLRETAPDFALEATEAELANDGPSLLVTLDLMDALRAKPGI